MKVRVLRTHSALLCRSLRQLDSTAVSVRGMLHCLPL
jgi:hypothetical protein